MNRKGKIIDRISLATDLPGEYMPGVPVIEICNDSRVLIENHKGVTAYDENTICVNVRYGCICVCGSRLELAQMSHHQLIITGHIDAVSLKRR